MPLRTLVIHGEKVKILTVWKKLIPVLMDNLEVQDFSERMNYRYGGNRKRTRFISRA